MNDVRERNVEMPEDTLNHLHFKRRKVKFYDEDIEKMAGMSLEEMVEYKSKLKAEKRYVYVKEDENQ